MAAVLTGDGTSFKFHVPSHGVPFPWTRLRVYRTILLKSSKFGSCHHNYKHFWEV